ncbi:hypothetical protein DYB36_010130 [Aphanomyces astaci]|uniref:CBP/p300-type HAT domain-containing protein n=3 Tax=Aphanomyces astaci TaxID=112090 RepID=A0A397BJZ9_APHAT|nr:hypothetical protein DYB36_010130 [Aphanomyces astaci]
MSSHASYQFDSLRRAKHSTMMLLHQMINASVPQCNTFCHECALLITHADHWFCRTWGPSTASTESDDPTKPRRRADPFSSVYATDFASSEYRDSLSPDHNFDGIVLSDPFRRKDRVKPELDHPVPFFSYYHQASTQRRSSLESQDSSIISYTESDKVRGTTTSSTADETPRQLPHTPMMAYQPNHRDDSMSSSVTASREMWRISGHSASMSSAGFDLLQSPSMGSAGVFSLPEKMTMLDDSASQTSSRESYDI